MKTKHEVFQLFLPFRREQRDGNFLFWCANKWISGPFLIKKCCDWQNVPNFLSKKKKNSVDTFRWKTFRQPRGTIALFVQMMKVLGVPRRGINPNSTTAWQLLNFAFEAIELEWIEFDSKLSTLFNAQSDLQGLRGEQTAYQNPTESKKTLVANFFNLENSAETIEIPEQNLFSH